MIDRMIQMITSKRKGDRGHIFCYHSVSSLTDTMVPSTNVDTGEFIENLELLRFYGANFVSGIQLADYYYRNTPFPPCSVLITFDDGFKNYITEILPILEDFQIPSILFVTTDYIDTEIPYSFVSWKRNKRFSQNYLNRCHSEFKSLTSHDILELNKNPLVEIGAHSCSHPYLTRITQQLALSEILESKIRLESILGIPIIYFAYPHGDYSKQIVDFVSKNFKLGFSINRGTINFRSNPHKLCRVSIKEKTSKNQIRKTFLGFNDFIRFFDPLRAK
jgi:peptidoglycan/xylan/chitin deacetylase (PgdA/CDA1 family)